VRQVADIVRDVVAGSEVAFSGQSGPDPRNYRVDFTKAARVLPEFRTRWTVRQGAVEVYDALRSHGVTQTDFSGPLFIRLAHIRQLKEAGALDDQLRWQPVAAAAGETR
jgi:hypothetical protein